MEERQIYLAGNLRELRARSYTSLQELQFATEISRGTLRNLEQGNTNPRLRVVVQLAAHYGVSLDDLVLRDLSIDRDDPTWGSRYGRRDWPMDDVDTGEIA
jgi:transcriptional regulator with XRE-family HTH domain